MNRADMISKLKERYNVRNLHMLDDRFDNVYICSACGEIFEWPPDGEGGDDEYVCSVCFGDTLVPLERLIT